MRAADEPRKSKLNSYFTVKAGRRSHKEASGFAVRWRDRKENGACDGRIFARSAASTIARQSKPAAPCLFLIDLFWGYLGDYKKLYGYLENGEFERYKGF